MVRSLDVSTRQDETVSVVWVERMERRPMSLEEYLALPEGTRAEYSDGVAIMTPPPDMPHNAVEKRLLRLLEDSLPDVYAGHEMGVVLGPRRRRVPDVAVIDRLEATHFTEQVPHLVVEVLSPSTRSEDLVVKAQEYAVAGVGQYWVVDREAGSMTIFTNVGDGWEVLAALDSAHPRTEVEVPGHGTVALDLDALLAI